ncbi:MAG: glycine cleavage system aminomethyltransferase GcvT [Actinomycetota bacterium]
MKSTPLQPEHEKLGASFTDFGGWNMPVRYGSDLAEHHAVRESAGLFDISHMAEFWVSGSDAGQMLDQALVNPPSEIAVGRAKYNLICNPQGGVIDDLIVYRISEDEFLVIANAGNRDAVSKALGERTLGNAKVEDQSDDWALLALQGPKATAILQKVASIELEPLRYYSIAKGEIAGTPTYFCRTGYTGEDGFEVLIPASAAGKIWQLLLETGGQDLTACGLAARDTLRLEAGMPLYGHELGLDRSPFEANLGRSVKLEREFVGSEALTKIKADGIKSKLFGLKGEGKRAARADYEIFLPGSNEVIGTVTSGALSPTLGYPVAMAYLSKPELEVGAKVEVDIRGTRTEFEIAQLPFYKRS